MNNSTEIIEALAYTILRAVTTRQEELSFLKVFHESHWRSSADARKLAREIAEEVMVKLDDDAGITMKSSHTKLTRFIDNLVTVPAHVAYSLADEFGVKETEETNI